MLTNDRVERTKNDGIVQYTCPFGIVNILSLSNLMNKMFNIELVYQAILQQIFCENECAKFSMCGCKSIAEDN